MIVDKLRENVVEEAKDYIDDEMDNYLREASEGDDAEDVFETIYHDMFNGSVTGNDNGSYSYSRNLSMALIVGVINTPEFIDMTKEFDIDIAAYIADGDWEDLEVGFRCYLLDEAYFDLYDYFIQKLED